MSRERARRVPGPRSPGNVAARLCFRAGGSPSSACRVCRERGPSSRTSLAGQKTARSGRLPPPRASVLSLSGTEDGFLLCGFLPACVLTHTFTPLRLQRTTFAKPQLTKERSDQVRREHPSYLPSQSGPGAEGSNCLKNWTLFLLRGGGCRGGRSRSEFHPPPLPAGARLRFPIVGGPRSLINSEYSQVRAGEQHGGPLPEKGYLRRGSHGGERDQSRLSEAMYTFLCPLPPAQSEECVRCVRLVWMSRGLPVSQNPGDSVSQLPGGNQRLTSPGCSYSSTAPSCSLS